jgi:Zn-dependent peptidase ImmA (M78 family)
MNVNINNISWKIKFIPGSSGDLKRYDGTYTIGMTDNNQKTIFLYNNLSDKMLYKVLCHELVHAFCFSYDLLLDRKEEERLADFIATYGRDIFDMTDELIGDMIKRKIS